MHMPAGRGGAERLVEAPAGSIASRPLRVRSGMGLPHVLQNAVAKLVLGAGRSARPTPRRAATGAPRLSRSPRRNAQSRMLSGSASNGSSGSDRAIEWSLDVERDLATEAAPAKCCHPRLPTRFVPRKRSAPCRCIEDCGRRPSAAITPLSSAACPMPMREISTPTVEGSKCNCHQARESG